MRLSKYIVATYCLLAAAKSADAAPLTDPIVGGGIQSIISADISFDGRRLAFSALRDGVSRTYIRDVAGGALVLLPPVGKAGEPRWSADNRHLYVTSDPGGKELAHVVVYDADAPDRAPVDLTPFPGKTAFLVDVNNPDGSALVGLNLVKDEAFGLYRVGPGGGAPQLVRPAVPDGLGWLISDAGQPVGQLRGDGAGGVSIEVKGAGRAGMRRFSFPASKNVPGDTPIPIGGVGANKEAWLLARGGLDTTTLQRVDLAAGRVVESVPNDSGVDTDLVMTDRDGRPLIVENIGGRPVVRVFDPQLARLLSRLPLPMHAHLQEGASDRAVNRLLLLFVSPSGEHDLVFLDRKEGQASLLFREALPASEDALPRTVPVTIASRDGLTLHGYITVPPNRPARRLPLVLLVHGGPWIRDAGTFDIAAARLALSGYAVLRVNYRGSGGYGRRFEAAGLGEWGGRMQDDLTDAACWAVRQGVADADRMAIMGGSYGGYAAAEALVRTPELFAAAVTIDAPFDLPAFLAEMRPYARRFRPMMEAYIGGRSAQWERSPLAHVDRIRRPILAFQGVNDPRVNKSQLEKFERTMRAAGNTIEAFYLGGEGHGLGAKDQGEYLRSAVQFLDRRLAVGTVPKADLSYCQQSSRGEMK